MRIDDNHSLTARCQHCPTPADVKCVGREATSPIQRYCELIDPTHKDYRPAYIPHVISESKRIAALPAAEPLTPSPDQRRQGGCGKCPEKTIGEIYTQDPVEEPSS
jgi:hypothetical protein